MDRKLATVIVSAVALAAGAAMAQGTGPKTRAQVRAEYLDALRTGDIIDTETGYPRYQVFPYAYPQRPAPQVKTRAQVRNETLEAMRRGEMMNNGFAGTYDPTRTMGNVGAPTLSRQEVRSETVRAVREHQIPESVGGE